MRRRGVDHAGGVVGDERDAFARGVVGKAQDGHVGGVEELGPCLRVLAALDRRRDDLDVVAAGQQGPYLQARRSVFAVDEDFRFHALEFLR